MYIKENIKLHNKFEIIVSDMGGDAGRITAIAENVVLNQLYPKALSPDQYVYFNYINVGSGTAEPLPTDTDLTQHRLQKIASSASWDLSQVKTGGTGICVFTGSCRIETNELVGINISEVGLGGNGLVTKALLKDANGNPLVIAKTNTMTVDIYATAFLTVPETVSGFPLRGLAGVNNEFFYLLSGCQSARFSPVRRGRSWKDAAYPNTALEVPSATITASRSTDTANLKNTYTIPNIAVGSANVGGIRSITVGNIEMPVPNDTALQPPIIKEVVGVGDGTTKIFSTEFGWVRDNSTAKVYVNDIEVASGVFVVFDSPPSPHGSYYFTEAGTRIYKNETGKKLGHIKMVDGNDYWYTSSISSANNPGGPWTKAIDISKSSTNVLTPIPAERQSDVYWRIDTQTPVDYGYKAAFFLEGDIQFDAPPASGATISVTYQPDCIAKDETKIINNLSYAIGL